MPISLVTARVHLKSKASYTQSRYHQEPELEGETKPDYDRRTWRSHQHVKNGRVHIPARAFHQALADGARYSKRQIPGQGKATWTAKFQSGIAILEDVDLGLDPEQTDYIDLYMHVNGQRGSGKRTMRRFPIIPSWEAAFEVVILDPIITEDVFIEMMEIAGLFIGIGQYRPQIGGTSGRFELVSIDWLDDRQPVRRVA